MELAERCSPWGLAIRKPAVCSLQEAWTGAIHGVSVATEKWLPSTPSTLYHSPRIGSLKRNHLSCPIAIPGEDRDATSAFVSTVGEDTWNFSPTKASQIWGDFTSQKETRVYLEREMWLGIAIQIPTLRARLLLQTHVQEANQLSSLYSEAVQIISGLCFPGPRTLWGSHAFHLYLINSFGK